VRFRRSGLPLLSSWLLKLPARPQPTVD
jgi:hypothetical protein